MNILSMISVVVFLMFLQLGIYVLTRNIEARINQIFFGLTICFALWAFGYIFVYSAESPQMAEKWDMVASLGYILFPAPLVLFYLKICNCWVDYYTNKTIFGVLLVAGLLFVFARFTGLWEAESITESSYGWSFEISRTNIFYPIYYLYLSVVTFFTLYILIRWRLKISDDYEKVQFKYLFYPLLLFFILGVTFDIILPNLNISELPNIGQFSSLPWLAGVAFVITKYHLLGNENNLISEHIVREIKEITIFTDLEFRIIRSNSFTCNLLGIQESEIEGMSLFKFTSNPAILKGYLLKSNEKQHIGPIGITLLNSSKDYIETSLNFLAIKDRFNDLKGYIIYGHDNREALNLQKEIFIRQHAEKNLRAISEVLETRVKERTGELANSYKELQIKMTERMRVEEQIKADIAEKEVLINEIHNRVKNNMNIIISLINAQDKKNIPAAASKKFRELAQRVKSLLLVHQNLYLSINYSDVDFAGFLKTLTNDLFSLHKRNGKVELRMDVSDVFLDVDYAIPLGIIVNELISNALQHGFSDYYLKKYKEKKHILHIGYSYDKGYYEIDISDNGKGLPGNFDISSLMTSGLPLVEILANDQINGKIDINSSEEGSIFRITFLAIK
jgi:two-component sensor histidine kinase